MRPIEIPALSPDAVAELDNLYHSTRQVRLRTTTRPGCAWRGRTAPG